LYHTDEQFAARKYSNTAYDVQKVNRTSTCAFERLLEIGVVQWKERSNAIYILFSLITKKMPNDTAHVLLFCNYLLQISPRLTHVALPSLLSKILFTTLMRTESKDSQPPKMINTTDYAYGRFCCHFGILRVYIQALLGQHLLLTTHYASDLSPKDAIHTTHASLLPLQKY
jgi:hypothetical protein